MAQPVPTQGTVMISPHHAVRSRAAGGGRRIVEIAEGHIVGAVLGAVDGLVARAAGDADDRVGSRDAACLVIGDGHAQMHAVGAHGAREFDAVLDQEGDVAFLRQRSQSLDGGAERAVIEAGRKAQQQAGHVRRGDSGGEGRRQPLAVAGAGQARRRQVEPRG